MSTVPVNNITWNSGVVELLLDAIISTVAHLNAKKWKEAALNFYGSMPHLMDFYRSNEDIALRRNILTSRKEFIRQWDGEIIIKVISPFSTEKVKARQKRLGDMGVFFERA